MSGVRAHVLVVGGGAEIPGIIRKIGGEGARTSVICRTSVVGRLKEPEGHTRVVALPADADPQEWVHLSRALHEADPFTAVGSYAEIDQDHAARIAAALGVPMHDPQTVAAAHDKALMRALLREAGVDDTPAAVADDLAEAQAFADRHGYPLIAKPVRGAGSTYVARIGGADELEAAFRRASTVSDFSSGTVLLERFMTGPQVSVEGLSENGDHLVVGVTAKFSEPEHLVEIGHVCPAELDDVTDKNIACYVSTVLTTLGVRDGATHTELVLTSDGPRVIETHVRLAGDEIPDLVREAVGVDLVECVAKQALGIAVLDDAAEQLAAAPPRASAIWYAVPGAAGTLRAVEGIDEAAGVAGVTAARAMLSPGDRTGPLRSSYDRGACVRVLADTSAEAVRVARDAASRITFVVEARQSVTETL